MNWRWTLAEEVRVVNIPCRSMCFDYSMGGYIRHISPQYEDKRMHPCGTRPYGTRPYGTRPYENNDYLPVAMLP